MLSVVPTPIGNLGDITLRAVEVLRAADLVAAEDTRRSGLLLQHLGIKKPFVSLHEHNEAARTSDLADRIAAGAHVALITDAGMPGISDPGFRLIRECRSRNLNVTVLPGASAVPVALVGSAFPSDRFYFGGFLPVKSGRREKILAEALARPETCLYFESPHRIERTLDVIASLEPGRAVCVARELSKAHEEFVRGTAGELLEHFRAHPPRGEITLVLAGSDTEEDDDPASSAD